MKADSLSSSFIFAILASKVKFDYEVNSGFDFATATF